jgi:hypothetical protein
MALPDRDSLLDLEWLTRTQAAEPGPRLRDLVREAADVYGGLLTPFDREMRRRGYQLTRYADDWR